MDDTGFLSIKKGRKLKLIYIAIYETLIINFFLTR